MVQYANLLLDGIDDNSMLQGGFPVANRIYSIPCVMNSACYLLCLCLQKIIMFCHPDAVKIFSEQLLEFHQGKGLAIYWRNTYTCPTEAQYTAMVLKKTGRLLGLAVRLMQLFSDDKRDLKPVYDTLALFFQIMIDYENFNSKEYSENTIFCEDLTEGTYSFPVMHAIWSKPESTLVQNILRQRTENMEIKKYCVQYLEKVGSFEYTRQTLKELESEMYREIEKLGGNPELVGLVQHLSNMYIDNDNTDLQPTANM
ncbi:geranylgeranyl pyrophosphate synthase-like [Ambystoma mexicanum]|uniref:geranylgeranyl pyrophosphate synthase-like n=1 Tax=Ambystoma mexicanum TaxID=8296 RepID=UPI0037E70C99